MNSGDFSIDVGSLEVQTVNDFVRLNVREKIPSIERDFNLTSNDANL